MQHQTPAAQLGQTRNTVAQEEELRFEKSLSDLTYSETYLIRVTASNRHVADDGPTVTTSITLFDGSK